MFFFSWLFCRSVIGGHQAAQVGRIHSQRSLLVNAGNKLNIPSPAPDIGAACQLLAAATQQPIPSAPVPRKPRTGGWTGRGVLEKSGNVSQAFLSWMELWEQLRASPNSGSCVPNWAACLILLPSPPPNFGLGC